MKKTFSVNDILWAFIENADDAHRSIRVSMAGTPWGYVRITIVQANKGLQAT